MNFGLEGKVAIVTGGAAGIGAAIAEQLAREGCDVAIVDRAGGERAAAVAKRIEAAGRRASVHDADVSDFALAERTVAAIAAAHGRVDVLVCCAGITDDGLAWKLSEAQWDRVLDVNLKGCFNWCRAVAPPMRDARGGRIVNIASINGLRGKFGQANYAASKGGMVALSKTLARELGKFGVTVNVVAPGMVRTEMAASLPYEVIEKAVDETLVGRLAEPADCAAVVAFLCSDAARHVTGQVVKVDGGQYL
jgi:3-oxoacyl-[acyl-carrier protein] reductase